MICQTCIQLSAMLCTWKLMVDLQVAGLVDLGGGGKQQAPGLCSDQYNRRH